MKKIRLLILPIITIVLEILPYGAVLVFAHPTVYKSMPLVANRQGEGDVFIFQPDAVWVCKFCTVYNCNAHLRSFIACVDFN